MSSGKNRNRWVQYILILAALITIITTFGIVYILVSDSVMFFKEISVTDFLFGKVWNPLIEPNKSYGVLPLVMGTLYITFGAAIIALPLGLGSAIYLTEYASPRFRKIVKPILEILAGVPTVVYGYFALTFITPNIIKPLFPQAGTFNALSASIAVGIMILPMVVSLSEDALSAVPSQIREGAYGLGSTRFEVATRVMLPASLSGILSSFILAISRAIGETMIVAIAAGMRPQLTSSFLKPIQTMTSYIVQVSLGDTPVGSLDYYTIFAVGLLLFLITLSLNLVSHIILRKYREVYE
ncbi:MAG: phosphate ABC transporter permease subunit PstC [Halanaerobiales bacterium]|nr:phosphate ABC transporter permease subunit PstC [Halanaerobiales bacterium]